MSTISISLPKAEPQAYLLCAMRIIWIALPLLFLLPLHLVWHLLKLPSPWAMLFLRIAARALGARVKVHGTPLRRDVFFVANHLSWHDIPILAGITGTAFVAQDGVRDWPIIGWLATLNRTIFVSRTEKQNVAGQVAELREAIAENWSVTLFPEGTTSDGRQLLPFKQSLFATLAPPPKPMLIQPVLLDFGDAGPDIAWLGEETGWESAWRAFTRPGTYDVGVHFLEPFNPAEMADRKVVCALSRARLASALSATLGYTVT
ncbi:MAG TPA: lysophospholipid acyltransferase family protein [Sphingorhabdus lacus]|jgi:1-acyl-sn-glycerol-3-phosphate acyltransferase|uniref:lysophospholipid acyltransferase family protein n=1 Tax=Sphingorhabdus lacus TaxID=392610 RepID=UPI001FE74F36|nr:lysophospholipid acyltransferase family protein [Sphingorhabdus lacus]HNW18512.1 lysophospholipid acyltransferase family protein [Sphingorhabdus lacus]HPV68688.1 lysophospholipid acyltransferase family protein [Sphingorhabdus lacus]